MASIEKRGKHWRARVWLLGVDESESFLTKGQASAWATHIESDILSGKHKPKSDKSLKEAFAKYARLRIPLKVATQTAGMLPPKPLIVATPFGAERRGKLCFTLSL
jgi:hypothetical protein